MMSHTEKIRSIIRKNNIFGERDDFIALSFLSHGGEAIFYSPTDETIAFGRSEKQLYIILLKHIHNADEKDLSDKSSHLEPSCNDLERISQMAITINARPLYAVIKTYCKNVKWFDIFGKKLTHL